MKRLIPFGIALAVAVSGWADTLYLRDGEQESGKLVKMTGKQVWFEGDDGLVKHKKTDVLKVQLQQTRAFDDVDAVDEVADPDLRACIDTQPSEEDFPAAGSVTLFERRTYDITRPDILVTTTRRIVKVLQQRGEKAATQSVHYFDDTDAPRIDFALTVTPDGRVLHLSDAALKTESLYARLPEYRRRTRYRFACKEPRPGSILDVQYTVTQKQTAFFKPLYTQALFRANGPVLRKEIVVLVPKDREDEIHAHLAGPEAVAASRSVDGDVVRLTWTLTTPQRGIVPEPLMPPQATFVPTLTLWQEPPEDGSFAAYSKALAALPPLPKDLAEKAKTIASEVGSEGVAEAIHNYVARNIRTVSVPQLHFSLVPHAPGETAQRGIANELDKNFLYFKLLEAAGVQCAFGLVRTRTSGPLPEDVDSLKAFSRSAVLLTEPDTFSSASSDLLPFPGLPGSLRGSPAIVVLPGAVQARATQDFTPEQELDLTRFEGALAADGTLDLTVTFSGTNSAGSWMRNLKDLDEQKLANQLGQIAAWLHPASVLEGHRTTDLADLAITPEITLECAIPGFATAAGEDLLLFTLPAISYSANQVGRPTREHDLFWPRVAREATEGTITIPDGFKVYSAPEDAAFESPVADYHATITDTDGIRFSDRYDLKVAQAPATAYPAYKACLERRARLPRQRIILMRTGGGLRD